ncbi:MAG: transglycosylase SLT domain-containing protein [Candidatus Woesearchaeota archaeon]
MTIKSKINKGLRNTALAAAVLIPSYHGADYVHDRAFNQIPNLQTFEYTPNQVFDMLTQTIPELYGNEQGINILKQNPASYRELATRVSQKYEQKGWNSFENYNLEDVLLGIMTIESGGKRDARSRSGASGIMQLMPPTAQQCGIEPSRINHRFLQMDCAADLLNRSYRFLEPTIKSKFGDLLSESNLQELTEHFAITAYNNGMGNVRNRIESFDVSTFERLNMSYNPFFDLEEVVPMVIGAGDMGPLNREALEYFPRFLQIYDDVINPSLFSNTKNKLRWKLNGFENYLRYSEER